MDMLRSESGCNDRLGLGSHIALEISFAESPNISADTRSSCSADEHHSRPSHSKHHTSFHLYGLQRLAARRCLRSSDTNKGLFSLYLLFWEQETHSCCAAFAGHQRYLTDLGCTDEADFSYSCAACLG